MIAAMLLIPFATAALILAQTVDLSKADQWEKVGDGIWTFQRGGVIVGERDETLPPPAKDPNQAWLYSKQEFGEYDLHAEWWTRFRGNSGISIRDTSRGHFSCCADADRNRTPSHIGYEIQISNGYTTDKYPSGSIYLFQAAKTGFQFDNDWNAFDIEVRDPMIRVKLNGHLVAEHAGDPARPKRGPIGLQLHDGRSVVMFRNIRVRQR